MVTSVRYFATATALYGALCSAMTAAVDFTAAVTAAAVDATAAVTAAFTAAAPTAPTAPTTKRKPTPGAFGRPRGVLPPATLARHRALAAG